MHIIEFIKEFDEAKVQGLPDSHIHSIKNALDGMIQTYKGYAGLKARLYSVIIHIDTETYKIVYHP